MYVPERVCISLCVSVPRLGLIEVRTCLCKGSVGCMIGGFTLEVETDLEDETENMVYGVGSKSMTRNCEINIEDFIRRCCLAGGFDLVQLRSELICNRGGTILHTK